MEQSNFAAGGDGLNSLAPAGAVTAGAVQYVDPVLISLVRRTMPKLLAYDVCGVQPLTGPTGLIFAMRSQYGSPGQLPAEGATVPNEAFFGEANTAYTTNATGGQHVDLKDSAAVTAYAGGGADPIDVFFTPGGYGHGFGTGTSTGENMGRGVAGVGAIPEMSFSIEKVTVSAKSRALKAEYTTELAQDLKAIHGLDAEAELANMLSAELLAEINREVVTTVRTTAVEGAQGGVAVDGTFDLDVDANGRWSVEKFKGLMFQIEREANAIAKATRRGKGNMLICSSDVASALQMAGMLDNTPALNSNNLNVDDTGNTFVGVLNGRYRVYIDPYATTNFMVVGYKGSNAFDAGLFYCPYVPLQMVRAVGENSFQSKLGFKTRYGMVANPFSQGATASGGWTRNDGLDANSNVYYRRVTVTNIL